MRQILLAGLPPNTGEWLAYRLRGETVEVLFSADDLVDRVRGECAPSLVVLSVRGSEEWAERDVARVRAACGPAVPIVVEVDSEEAGVSPVLLGKLVREHGVRRVVPSSALRADLLNAVLACLPDAAPPRPPVRRIAVPAMPVRRFPDASVVDGHHVPSLPARLDLPLGGVLAFEAPAPPVAEADRPDSAAAPSSARPRVLVVSADGALRDAFAAGVGVEYDVRVGTFGELLRLKPDGEDAPAAVVVDVPEGQGERVWKLLERLGRGRTPLPVLVATASDGLEDRVNAVRVGAHACLQKPVDPATAREVLARAVPPREPLVPRVLVVDADAEVLRSADALFGRLGWQVHTASEPAAVWQALADTRPDLLILASELGGMDGLDLCRAVRADPRWHRLPVLFLAAEPDTPWLWRAYAAGADDHVAKPFWGPELVSRARNRLRRLEMGCTV